MAHDLLRGFFGKGRKDPTLGRAIETPLAETNLRTFGSGPVFLRGQTAQPTSPWNASAGST